MNNQALEQARTAYRAGDYAAAAQLFSAAKDPSETYGEVDHLRGNSLMRLGRYADAAAAYEAALADTGYGKRGALLTNRGKALVASGDLTGAVTAFTGATQDASYATPYKAYLGLGGALEKLGNLTEAGVAYRQAAIDGTNPAPASALASLGDCFVALQRPEDAIESYRTALDFIGPRDDVRAINAGLGQAYVATSRFSDAVEVFDAATADGIYQLSPDQQAAYDRARDTISAHAAMMPATGALTPNVDPLDPLGQSGNFIPDPSDTGFFTLSEHEVVQQDRAEAKVRRKHRHAGLKVFLVVLLLLVIAGAAGAFAFTRGFGIPSQQDVLTDLFTAVSDGAETKEFLASGLDESDRSLIEASIPVDATPTIKGMDAGMSETKATVSVKLKKGGEMTYEVDFVREGLGWAVSNIVTDFNVEETE
ncbi:MAG: tetratricopeptide repeat protein [Coriobacteriaceae bacterium]|nr:tetratricopeptide repeat protein [Coriobacteriaceae bacterium]